MGTAVGELEMVAVPDSAQHDTNEPFMVFEPSNLDETEALALHGNGALHCSGSAGDAQVNVHWPSGMRDRSNVLVNSDCGGRLYKPGLR